MGRVLGYALLRIVMWVVLWYLLVLVGLGVYIAGVLAVLIAMMLSFLLFGGVRRRAAEGLQEVDERRRRRRGPEVDEDAESEDALLDGDAPDTDQPEDRRPDDPDAAAEDAPGSATALPESTALADEDDIEADSAAGADGDHSSER